MSLTLNQLKEKRDNHVKKIEEYKRKAETNISYQTSLNINIKPKEFFNSLDHQTSEAMENITTMYPYLTQMLEFIFKSSKEEQKRRECEKKIAMMKEKRLKKRKREDEEWK